VRVTIVDSLLRIEVADDGIGGAHLRPSGGLMGLDDRIQALGGTMTLGTSATGRGTTVRVILPITVGGPD
jgi:signal transduction histidine kinase